MKSSSLKNLAYFFIAAAGVIMTLKLGQDMLIQLIIAYLIWFATTQIKKSVKGLPIFKSMPSWLQSVVILLLLLGVVSLVLMTVASNVSTLVDGFSTYEANISSIAHSIEKTFDINLQAQLTSVINSLNIKGILSGLASSISSILGSGMMILIYLLFLFLETSTFGPKIKALFPQNETRERFTTITTKIENSLSGYFRVKTLMSLLTAGLSFVVFWLVGVDSPVFWAFLIFLLNYIPTIGSLIATTFPAVFSLLQFGTFGPAIIILISVGVIQQIVGNLIEPKFMGKTLNVSPFVTILALTVWGMIWGTIGMLLSVPITVIMIIIFSQFPSTKKVAILLSEKGEI